MAGNGLLIGPNLGEATVFDSQPAVQNFANTLALQKAKRDAEIKILQDQLGKASPAGIREPDREGYMQQYSGLQDLGRQKINERDPYKKAQIQAQIDKGFQDLGQYVSQSKQYGSMYGDFGKRLLDHSFRNQFADPAVDQYSKSAQLSMNDPKFVKDFNTLQRQPDITKYSGIMDKVDKGLYDATKYNTGIDGKPLTPAEQRVVSGNKQGSIFTNQKVVNPQQQAMAYAHLYDTDHDFKAYARALRPDLSAQYPNDNDFKKVIVPQLVQDRKIESKEKPGSPVWDDKPDNFMAHHIAGKLWDRAHGFGSEAGNQYFTGLTNGIISGNKTAHEAYINSIPKKGFKDGEVPSFSTNEQGQQVLTIPEKVAVDPKVQKELDVIKSDYEASPAKKNKTLGLFGGQKVPFEESDTYKDEYLPKLAELHKHKEDAQTYVIPDNPKDARAILAQAGSKNGMAIGAQNSVNKNAPPVVAKAAPTGHVTVQLPDGTTGQIPKGKLKDFQSKYPHAKILQ